MFVHRICFFISIFTLFDGLFSADVTIIGVAHAARSIGQHTKGFIDCLKDKASVDLLVSSWSDLSHLPDYMRDMILDPENVKKITSPVLIYTDTIMGNFWDNYLTYKYDGIRIAFSWTDYSALEYAEVDRLNSFFDAVVVPDEYLIDVYAGSGVKIPIFVLPESIDLNLFFKNQPKKKPNKHFVFGCSAMFVKRKNLDLLIDAFHKEFGKNQNVILKLHGRWGNEYQNLRKKIDSLNTRNIVLIKKVFTPEEYRSFITSLDCYVLISKAEAFSISPREALAAGIPCIISNNTAHKTLCKTGYYYPVKSEIRENKRSKAINGISKFQFNCHCLDVQAALCEVYSNYEVYLQKAHHGREWIHKYCPENLNEEYMALVNPCSVTLSQENTLSKKGISTTSPNLYAKYKKLIKKEEVL